MRPEFFYETMPYFSDPHVGIVQTAQYYEVSNPSFSYIQRYAGTLQEIFFRFIQPARDRYKAAICAGTNVIYRRAAVLAAGGFAWVPIGEDVHSGVKLAWAGYETRYLPLCLAKRRASRLPFAGQPAGPLVPLLDATDDGEAFPGRAVHLEAAGSLLGSIPVLHVVGYTASDRTVSNTNDGLVLSRG